MKDHHLQLNLAKTELLVVSANPLLHHNFTFQLDSSTMNPSKQQKTLELWLIISWDSQTTLLKLHGSAPLYLNSLLQTYVPPRSLCSASKWRIIVPSQRGKKSLSQTFSLTVPIWWIDLPNSIRAAESLSIFKKWIKHIIFHPYLTL